MTDGSGVNWDKPGGQQQPGGYGQQPGFPPPPAGGAYPPAPPGNYGYPTPAAPWPQGVTIASRGRRVGAFFLAIPLTVVTLGIGYVIWGAIVWGKGTSPALQVLGMRVWNERDNRPATWGTMALRDIVGGIVQGILSIITALISFILFLGGGDRPRTIPDRIGGTLVLHDPNKVLG